MSGWTDAQGFCQESCVPGVLSLGHLSSSLLCSPLSRQARFWVFLLLASLWVSRPATAADPFSDSGGFNLPQFGVESFTYAQEQAPDISGPVGFVWETSEFLWTSYVVELVVGSSTVYESPPNAETTLQRLAYQGSTSGAGLTVRVRC